MKAGTRVRLTRNVERYPHFVAEAGRTGTVTTYSDDLVAVRLDDPLSGAEEWENQVHWYRDQFEEVEFREVFRRDVEPLVDAD